MAFGANTIWDVRTSGSDSNGGGFNPGNANFPTDLAADTNTGNTSSPVVSSASYNFVAGDVGSWVFIKSGTNWIPGWYQIASVAANKATLTAGIGTAYLMSNSKPVSANTASGVATVGTPTGGTWGIDYSQQNSAQIAFTDMVIDGTTNTIFTSAGNPVGKNFVGNIINVTSGTGFTVQRVEVVSTSGTQATCDKSLGTLSSTGGNGNLGGSLGSPGLAGGLKVAGNDIFLKSGTYTITSSSANVSGGRIDDTTGGVDQANGSFWVGWNTNRHITNVDTTQATISAGAVTTITIFNVSSSHCRLSNIDANGNSQTSTSGIVIASASSSAAFCKARNTTVRGFYLNSGRTWLIGCEATGCSGTAAIDVSGADTATAFGCYSHDNTTHGFLVGLGDVMFCIADTCTGSNIDGFSHGSVGYRGFCCVSYKNQRYGFHCAGNDGFGTLLVNCVATENTGEGFGSDGVKDGVRLQNCAGWGNSGDYSSSNINSVFSFQTLTGNPFVDAPGGNFSPNNTAGAGALLRAMGFPGVFPGGLTTGYLDIGIQHQDSGGGGSAAAPFFETVAPTF